MYNYLISDVSGICKAVDSSNPGVGYEVVIRNQITRIHRKEKIDRNDGTTSSSAFSEKDFAREGGMVIYIIRISRPSV